VEYKWTVLTVTTVGVLMSGIDGRILIIGLPQIASAMHADAEQAIWFTQGYALASTIMLLLIGRVTDIFGRVKFYKTGFVIFTVAHFSPASLNHQTKSLSSDSSRVSEAQSYGRTASL